MKKLTFVLISLILSLQLQAAPGDNGKALGLADAPGQNGERGKSHNNGKGQSKEDTRPAPEDPTAAIEAQDRHTAALLAIAKVIGTGVSWDNTGAPVIKVFTAGKPKNLPTSLDGFPVVTEEVGNFYAMNIPCDQRKANAGCKGENTNTDDGGDFEAANAKDWQNRPVPIGVSIGTSDATAGTLGCRVSRGCHNYALSNSHVVANSSTALVQPAEPDGGLNPDDMIASLFQAVPITMSDNAANLVDAAIFQTEDSDLIGTATRSGGYGEPMTTPVDAGLALDVMKYGRSSALTTGYVDTINATVIVQYDTGSARFIDQFVIKSDSGTTDFTLPGDSGALVTVNGGDDDRSPVGLVFASGKGATLANPIAEVLAALDVNIDGES